MRPPNRVESATLPCWVGIRRFSFESTMPDYPHDRREISRAGSSRSGRATASGGPVVASRGPRVGQPPHLARETVALLEERLEHFEKHPETGTSWEKLRDRQPPVAEWKSSERSPPPKTISRRRMKSNHHRSRSPVRLTRLSRFLQISRKWVLPSAMPDV